MKTYKMWDLLEFKVGTKFIDELNNEFEIKYTNDNETCKGIWLNNCYDDDEPKDGFIYATSIWCNTDFRLIEQLVTWKEAFESGKDFRVQHELINKICFLNNDEVNIKEFNNFSDTMWILSKKLNTQELERVIKEGKWYLEQ